MVILFNVLDKILARTLLYMKSKIHESITPYFGGDHYGNILDNGFCRSVHRLGFNGWIVFYNVFSKGYLFKRS